jgi:hypothetical protein
MTLHSMQARSQSESMKRIMIEGSEQVSCRAEGSSVLPVSTELKPAASPEKIGRLKALYRPITAHPKPALAEPRYHKRLPDSPGELRTRQ